MRKLLLAFLLSFPLLLKAGTGDTSKVIGIHPAVGKSISRDEKIKYKLFPEYIDSLFESAEVTRCSDSTFLLNVRTVQGTDIHNSISTKQLDDLYYRIDDIEKVKKEPEYVMTEEEKKEERRKRNRQNNSDFWYDFLAQMTIATFEVIITAVLSN
jgi:hypothetical protein